MSDEPVARISAVMPAYNAARFLPRVLPPLMAMRDRGELAEVIVVDDRSTDGTAELAREMGARVLVTPVNGGPGAARNLAAAQAAGDILWFVDADVIAWEDGARRIAEAFRDRRVDAVFGSYDAEPDAPGWLSRYRNLVHRFYHQGARREASTFWAGCGAVRKSAFLAVGGFDVETYRVPSIEDIELGYRIRRNGGRILLLPDLLGKHLKRWTMRGVIETDIFRRALPWARLMIGREGLSDDLNTSRAERVRAGLAGLLMLSLAALPFAPALWPLPLGLLATALLINRRLFAFLFAHGGWGVAVPGFLWHQLYYVYSACAFVWCLVESWLGRHPHRPGPPGRPATRGTGAR
ncbi:MAG: glycosyltransferase [Alphaproteobacteria bacterium]|nr:MAG: glycosyltransferase [Alphaproteobacteria bacterium]